MTTDSRVPQVTGAKQSTNSNPIAGYPSVLVNDPVYLVNDTRVLVGSNISGTTEIRVETSNNNPNLTSRSYIPKADSNGNAPNLTLSPRR